MSKILGPRSTNNVKIAPLQNCKTTEKYFRPIEIYLNFDYVLLMKSPKYTMEMYYIAHTFMISHVPIYTWTWLALNVRASFWPGYSRRQRPICTPGSPLISPGGLPETRLWQGNTCQAGPRCGKHAQLWSVPHPGWVGPAGPCSEGFRTETKKMI